MAVSFGGLLCLSQTFGTIISLWVKVKRAYAYLKPDNKQTHTICSETLQWLQSCAVSGVCACLHLATEKTLNLTVVDMKVIRKFDSPFFQSLVKWSSDIQNVVRFEWHLKYSHVVCNKQPWMFHFQNASYFNFCFFRHWFFFLLLLFAAVVSPAAKLLFWLALCSFLDREA